MTLSMTTLTILHSNDTHGHLVPIPTPDGEPLGGYARRTTFIKRERVRDPHLLLLDAGDLYQGSIYWHAFNGEIDINLMNALAYDAATLGNHDNDGGLMVLRDRIAQANFPMLCANFSFPVGHILHQVWQPYLIKTVQGRRIAIVGLTVDTLQLYVDEFREQVQTRPVPEVARELVAHLKPQVDMLIVLSHLGHLGDVALAEAVPGIDLIIGGHTHTPLTEPHLINNIPIVRGIVGTQTMGRLQFALADGQQPQLLSYEQVPLDASIPDDPAVVTELTHWQAKLPPVKVVGQLITPLDTRTEVKGTAENTAGNFYADAMLHYFQGDVDIALVHMGTIRGDRLYPAGNFTNHDLSEFNPFDNKPILMELNAPQLKMMLERGVHALPDATGIFLSNAGLQVVVDLNRQPQVIDPDHPRVLVSGERVIRAYHHGQPIDFNDETRWFRACLDGYIGRGGAGYFVARDGRHIRQVDMGTSAIMRWYLQRHGPIFVPLEGRIVLTG